MTIAAFRTNQDLDASRLREAFGHFPSGVVAVAAVVDGDPVGLAASSFTSVSLDPPLVSVSVANTSRTWPDLRAADRLGVTVLAAHHGDACRQLAGPVEHRFDDLAWSVRPQGAVVLDDGLAQFDCSIHREVEAGDHTIVLLALHAVAEHAPDHAEPDAPLLFHRSRLGPIAG
ncbi:flavin reductase family protein [Nocardioides marmoraquaticus]